MKNFSVTNQDHDRGKDLLLEMRIFELCNEEYKDLSELARNMEISAGQIYRLHQGKCSINQKFIIGAMKAFPECKIGDLFYFNIPAKEAMVVEKLA